MREQARDIERLWHIDECINKIVEWTKVYFADKKEVPAEMDKEINEFFKDR